MTIHEFLNAMNRECYQTSDGTYLTRRDGEADADRMFRIYHFEAGTLSYARRMLRYGDHHSDYRYGPNLLFDESGILVRIASQITSYEHRYERAGAGAPWEYVILTGRLDRYTVPLPHFDPIPYIQEVLHGTT